MPTFEQDLCTTLQQIVNALLPALQRGYAACYTVYHGVGMPYGDTYEGCMQWVGEMLAREYNEQEIEQIRLFYTSLESIQGKLETMSKPEAGFIPLTANMKEEFETLHANVVRTIYQLNDADIEHRVDSAGILRMGIYFAVVKEIKKEWAIYRQENEQLRALVHDFSRWVEQATEGDARREELLRRAQEVERK